MIPGGQRMPQAPKTPAQMQVPSYMKNTETKPPVSPYARPTAPQAPTAPKAPVAPQAPVKPQAPVAPKAPVAPQAPVAPKAPAAPQAAPEQTAEQVSAEAPRRRHRPPVDPNA